MLLILAVAWFLAATLAHDPVSTWYAGLIRNIPRTHVEHALHWGSLVLGALLACGVLLRRPRGDRAFPAETLLVLVLLVGTSQWLISTNVERIHYPQYAVLAVLTFILTDDVLLTLLLCMGLGGADELRQYVLFPWYTKYLDLNDILLNLAGAAAGVWLVRGLGIPRLKTPAFRRWGRRLTWAGGLLTAGALTLLALGGRCLMSAPVPSDPTEYFHQAGRFVFVFSYLPPPVSYWLTGAAGRSYHILYISEWAITTGAVLLAYHALQRYRRRHGSA